MKPASQKSGKRPESIPLRELERTLQLLDVGRRQAFETLMSVEDEPDWADAYRAFASATDAWQVLERLVARRRCNGATSTEVAAVQP